MKSSIKRLCNAIAEFSKQSLLVITCTGKTFGVDHIRNVIDMSMYSIEALGLGDGI